MKSRKHNGIQDMRTAVKLAVKLPANVCQFTYRTPHRRLQCNTQKKSPCKFKDSSFNATRTNILMNRQHFIFNKSTHQAFINARESSLTSPRKGTGYLDPQATIVPLLFKFRSKNFLRKNSDIIFLNFSSNLKSLLVAVCLHSHRIVLRY